MSGEKEIKIHSIKYNFIMNAILKMSSFLFPLITFPYISRILGPEGNGKVSFASSVVYYFTVVASLGIPTYGIRICTRYRDDKEKLSRTVHELLMINSVLTVLSYVVLVILTVCVPRLRGDWKLLLVSSVTLVLSSMGVEWFYQAIEQYAYITYRNILFKIISIILMFLLVKDANDYIVYAGVQVLGNVGSNLLNMIRLRQYIIMKPMGRYEPLQHVKPAVTFFLLTVATTVYTNLDTVMLGFMAGDMEVGYYNAAVKMRNILVSLVSALGTVLLPRTSYYLQHGMTDAFRSVIEKSVKVVFIVALPLMFYCNFEAENIIMFLAGDGYREAVPTMLVLTPTIFIIGLSNITGLQILVPLGLEKYTVTSTMVGAMTDLVLNALLIPRYGALGAALGTLVTEIVVLGVQVLCVYKLPYVKNDWRDLLKIIAACLAAAGGMMVYQMRPLIENVFLELVISAIVFFGIDGLLLIGLKEDMVWQYLIEPLRRRLGN